MPETKETYSQRRRWLTTHFTFGRKKLEYGVTSKQEANLEESIGWETIGPRSGYVETVEADRDLRWTLFLMSGLVLFASFRGQGHPLLVMSMYGGVTAVAVIALLLTRKLRRVGYTAVPAGTFNLLVLDDKQHDTILAGIEARRADALLRGLASARDLTLRIYLRRLRWLTENGVMTPEAFLQRQATLLPGENLLPEKSAGRETIHFRQRRLAAQIDVTLEPAQLVYSRWTLFDGSQRFTVDYRNLAAPGRYEETEKQLELTGLLFAWGGAALISWGAWINQTHPAGYYVGGIGLQRAIIDFGPMLLLCFALAACAPMLTRMNVARPWPGLLFLKDRQYDAIVAAIEERRAAALHALTEPDPLLHPDEQVQVLDDLLENGVLTEQEHARAVERAELAFVDPALDQPMPEQPEAPRERILH